MCPVTLFPFPRPKFPPFSQPHLSTLNARNQTITFRSSVMVLFIVAAFRVESRSGGIVFCYEQKPAEIFGILR